MFFNSKFTCTRSKLPNGDYLVTVIQTTNSGTVGGDSTSSEKIPAKFRPDTAVKCAVSGWLSGAGWNYGSLTLNTNGTMSWQRAAQQNWAIWNGSFTFIKSA